MLNQNIFIGKNVHGTTAWTDIIDGACTDYDYDYDYDSVLPYAFVQAIN